MGLIEVCLGCAMGTAILAVMAVFGMKLYYTFEMFNFTRFFFNNFSKK